MEKSNKMTVFSCVTMSIGAIIGAGLFSSLPLGISMVGSNVGWAFVLGAVFIIIRTVPSLYMQSSIPISAGSYVYMARFIHPSVAFVQSLNSCVGMLNIAVMSMTFAGYFVQLFPNAGLNSQYIAVACAIVLTAIATFGARFTGSVQNIMVGFLLVALGVYIFFGIGAVPGETLSDYIKPTADFVTLWGAVAILNYALQGGAAVAAFADEVENPSFAIPVSFFAGTGFVTLLYCVIAYVTYGLGPVEGATGMDAYNLGVIAATFMSPLLVKFFIVCGALFATVTTLQSSLLLYSRMWYVSAKDGIWPKIFTRTNKYNVPWFALWFSTFCACAAILSGIQLSDVLKIVSIPGLLLGILFYYPCLAFLKRYPNAAKRSYLRVPTPVQVVLCLFSMGISFYMGLSLLTSLDSRLAATMIGFYVVGYGYYFLRYRYMKQHGLDIIAEGKKEPASWVERNRPLEQETVSAQ